MESPNLPSDIKLKPLDHQVGLASSRRYGNTQVSEHEKLDPLLGASPLLNLRTILPEKKGGPRFG